MYCRWENVVFVFYIFDEWVENDKCMVIFELSDYIYDLVVERENGIVILWEINFELISL